MRCFGKNYSVVIALLFLFIFSGCAKKADTGESNPVDPVPANHKPCSVLDSDHIIDLIEEPFKVDKVKGKIENEAGDWPDDVRPLISLMKMDDNQKIFRTVANGDGRFSISHVPPGRYCLEVRATGWQTVFAAVVVGENENTKSISIKLKLGV